MDKKYIDIHAHINFADFSDDRDEVVSRAQKNGVSIINVGTRHTTSIEVTRLTEKYENMYATIGVHPIYADKEEFNENAFSELLENKKVVAIGECGLDYYHLSGNVEAMKEKQKEIFRKQIELAIKFDRPMMIHCRDAYGDILEMLNEYKKPAGETLRGNIHFFAGTKNEAEKFLNLGFHLSFTGVITFAPQYKELVEFVPIDKIHAETDCPYVSPAPNRGKRNEPVFVIDVVKKIAEIKQISVDDLSKQLILNAQKLFNLPF
jgi:TatD DNase family protein